MKIETIQKKIALKTGQESELVSDAYEFAELKHRGTKRLSGEDYIQHPLEVANILVDLGLDEETVAAALLHDVVEDTDTALADIENHFGKIVAELVDGVTNLGSIDFSKLPSEEVQEAKFKQMIEGLRKFFLAMAKDIRVVIIKLADRLHNMRTLDALKINDQKRISRETLEIFAPLADRMGMGSIKAELEDLSFKYINPTEYKRISDILRSGEKERKHYLTKIKKSIESELGKEGIKANIDGRVKHKYSIYKKLNKVDGDFSKIYDILAIRIIVENVEDCYKALGIIHKLYKPLIYKIKDYIAVPKPNGYQSLHTTVFGIGGAITEIQIRSQEMHEEAENGVAAHWHYDESKLKNAYKGKASFNKSEKTKWINELMDWQNQIAENDDTLEALNIDFFNDRIFVNTPSGDVINLPDGATPVDFAYEIHSEIGRRCRGAKVNGRIVTLDHKLHNRDMIEIILAPKNDKSGPPRGWLDFVKTAKAKQHIRGWYKKAKRADNIIEGHRLLGDELALFNLKEHDVSLEQTKEVLGHSGWHEWDDVLASIGEGSVTARQIVKKIVGIRMYQALDDNKKAKTIALKPEVTDTSTNLDGILVRFAECCKPQKGDKVKGFITQGMGITIHRADCRRLLTSPQEKVIDINFDFENTINLNFDILVENRVGMIRDITQTVASLGLNIDSFTDKPKEDGTNQISMRVRVSSPMEATELIPRLGNIQGVLSVSQY